LRLIETTSKATKFTENLQDVYSRLRNQEKSNMFKQATDSEMLSQLKILLIQ